MILGNLINLGVKSDMEFFQKRETRMINLFSLITLCGLLVGSSIVFFISGDFAIQTVVFSAITSLTILYLNYRLLYNYSTTIFVITINITIFIINEQYLDAAGNYLYYYPVVFCVALIHNPSKPSTRSVVYFSIVLLSFILSRALKIPSLIIQSISEKDNEALLTYNSVLSFLVTVTLVYLVVKLINNQNNETLAFAQKEHDVQLLIAQSLKEKETLLAEIQHRVKNNLAIITGLLNLQTEKAPCEESRHLMIESRNRVMSISMVHERLYKKDNLSKINLKIYLSELIQELVKNYPINNEQIIEIEEDLEKIEIEVTKAVPIGLIINEALTNSLKHAFKSAEKQPIINIKMHLIFDKIQISLKDNGVGFSDTTKRKDTSLGLSLIESLSDQIDANVVFKNDDGACVSIVFGV